MIKTESRWIFLFFQIKISNSKPFILQRHKIWISRLQEKGFMTSKKEKKRRKRRWHGGEEERGWWGRFKEHWICLIETVSCDLGLRRVRGGGGGGGERGCVLGIDWVSFNVRVRGEIMARLLLWPTIDVTHRSSRLLSRLNGNYPINAAWMLTAGARIRPAAKSWAG